MNYEKTVKAMGAFHRAAAQMPMGGGAFKPVTALPLPPKPPRKPRKTKEKS